MHYIGHFWMKPGDLIGLFFGDFWIRTGAPGAVLPGLATVS